ncbi:prephenate dehydratase [Gnomoniopsis smithogilvyi]|uniref:prephenate dehydratase n=1 Tax=Gnomoniopsis smithogilvyi TaxID=1191159 RepID=A0A9W8YUZ4_9PEZI|nr:prephenate dehydratase [Gnomoniopsis smithogilvyi]
MGGDTSGRRPIVAFLGPPSSFTHQATKSSFSEEQYEYTPVITIKDVFDAVQSGAAEVGVVPFENSTHGVVNMTLDNLADRAQTYADLSVCGEVYLDVHHFLLGYKRQQSPSTPSLQQQQQQQQQHLNAVGTSGTEEATGTLTPTQNNPNPLRPRAKPLAPLDHVQRVLSHPQAFGQTNAFLSTYLRGVDCVDVSSTSKAAEMASRDETGATAAIAGEIAAEMFGLDVLARCIEDRDDNTTRFFVLRRRERGEGDGEGNDDGGEAGKGHKSLVSFTVPHSSPGALAGVLDVFRKYGLNLTSINSLPSLIQPFQYLFFVEFEGSRHHDPEGSVKSALEEVDKVAQGWRWLGSWESAR